MTYIYTYTCTPDELDLCELEQRSLFGKHAEANIIESSLQIDPSRSPFITGRLEVLYEGGSLRDILDQVPKLPINESTFKVTVDKNSADKESGKIRYEERRSLEREIGLSIPGQAELINPERVFGVLIWRGRWLFGKHTKNEAVWLRHMNKPQAYSTALSTRLARAIVNIAIPNPQGIRAIDPCCGIGTVLVEALSMGINIVGRDINPLVTQGARLNIAHFNLVGEVTLGAIQNVETSYDVAIIDLPYNLLSLVSPEDQFTMLQSAASFADKVVIVTVEPIDSVIDRVGLVIVDRCIAKKGVFAREVIVCKSELKQPK